MSWTFLSDGQRADVWHTVGREGQGPYEFRAPLAVAEGDEGRLYILDYGNGRISQFTVVGGELERVGGISLQMGAVDLCVVQARVFVLVPRGPNVIQELGEDGDVVQSFGPAGGPASQHTYAVNHGSLDCDQDGVYYVASATGRLRRYSLDGTLIWERYLPDFAAGEITVDRQMGLCCAYGPNAETGTMSSAPTLSRIGASLRVGVSELDPSAEVRSSYRVYTIDLDAGAEASFIEVPMVYAGASHERTVGYVQDGIPRVLVGPSLRE